eukprot:UN11055
MLPVKVARSCHIRTLLPGFVTSFFQSCLQFFSIFIIISPIRYTKNEFDVIIIV